jgi:cyclase
MGGKTLEIIPWITSSITSSPSPLASRFLLKLDFAYRFVLFYTIIFPRRKFLISHERVAENVFSFQSDVYAQVNAGVIAGPNWAVVIDTLAYPEETLAIREFVEQELKVPVRYVINTHHHADHCWGSCFFPGAFVISSTLCRKLLDERGKPSLEDSRKYNPGLFRQVRITLPHLTFERGVLGLQVGKKTLSLMALPGHSPDGIGVLLEEDRVLYSGDIMMPIPYFVDGNIDQMETYLKSLLPLGLENIVQGHGDIVLRGEVEGAIEENLQYLAKLRKVVQDSSSRRFPLDMLERVTVQSCGKSRVIMGGLAEDLHQRNLIALFRYLYGKDPIGSEEVHDLDDEYDDYDDNVYDDDYEEEPVRLKEGYNGDDDEDDAFERDEDTGAGFEEKDDLEEEDVE